MPKERFLKWWPSIKKAVNSKGRSIKRLVKLGDHNKQKYIVNDEQNENENVISDVEA